MVLLPLLKVTDVPGQTRLGNAQAPRGLGDGAQLGHGDEKFTVPHVHGSPYARKV